MPEILECAGVDAGEVCDVWFRELAATLYEQLLLMMVARAGFEPAGECNESGREVPLYRSVRLQALRGVSIDTTGVERSAVALTIQTLLCFLLLSRALI